MTIVFGTADREICKTMAVGRNILFGWYLHFRYYNAVLVFVSDKMDFDIKAKKNVEYRH